MHQVITRPVRVALSAALLMVVLGCDRNETPDLVPAPTRPPMPSPTVPPLPKPDVSGATQQPQPMPGQNNDHSAPGFKGGPTDPTR